MRWLDWKFIASLIALALAATMISSVLAKDRQVDQLVTENRALRVEAAKDRDQATAERAAAATEREQLLVGQRDLNRKYRELLEQSVALTDWLQAHGIVVPTQLVDVPSTSSSSSSSSTSRELLPNGKPAPTKKRGKR